MSDESKSVTKKARGLIGEFKAFISRGNVIDMAVGVIIATAFGKITTSLVNDVVMPAISYFIGSADATSLNITLRPEVVDEAGNVITEEKEAAEEAPPEPSQEEVLLTEIRDLLKEQKK